jgi:hypothetical protein
VVAEDHGFGTRYRLLETIRQYGEERLAGWGETEKIRTLHASFYATLSERAAEHFMGPAQIVWARQVNNERDNIRSALANSIDAGNAALAVQLVANHDQDTNASAIGELFTLPAWPVKDLPGAAEEVGYSRALILAAWHSFYSGDYAMAEELCRQAVEAEKRMGAPPHRPRIESDVCAMHAEASLSAGHYGDSVAAYIQAAQLAKADGYPGLAGQYMAFGVSSTVLGGLGVDEATTIAEESVALAQQSGMPAAIVLSLNALALTLIERDPERARSLLREVIQRSITPGAELPGGYLTGCLVASRLGDWGLTLTLTAKTMYLYRWSLYPPQVATCLAECARALADDEPQIAGVLHGAAYAAFRRASPAAQPTRRSEDALDNPNTNFLLTYQRETGDIVAAAIGDERRRELRAQGAAMSMDEAMSYALANIDPKLFTGPIPLEGKR